MVGSGGERASLAAMTRPDASPRRWWTGNRWIIGLAVAALAPLLIAAFSLSGRSYATVLDLAMTELRVRNVGTRHTPLIGLPGRIGHFPDQGSHPGPLSFYLLAVGYRLFGSDGMALLLGGILVNAAAVLAALYLAFRHGGWRTSLVAALAVLGVVNGLGIGVFTQPWNPYLPVLSWLVVLLCCWWVAAGDAWMLVPLVFFGSLCAQTHVPYLMLCAALCAAAFAVTIARHRARLAAVRRPLLVALAAGAVLWLPPVIDQLVNRPGNIRMLARHFLTPSEAPVGWGRGARMQLAALNIEDALTASRQLGGIEMLAGQRSTWPGLLLVLIWAGCAGIAWRYGLRSLLWLHGVLALTVVLQWMSMSRIFGEVWFYLTLWSWATTVVIALACAWTLWSAARHRFGFGERARAAVAVAGIAALLAGSVAAGAEATSAEVPEPQLSEPLAHVIGPTIAALRAEPGGLRGPYLVTWADPLNFGSQGFGLVNSLHAHGVGVGVDPPFRVPLTPELVLPHDRAVAEIHLAVGSAIATRAALPGYRVIAEFDRRTPAEAARYAELRAQVIRDLGAAGRDDLVPLVDTNLFGIQLDPRLPWNVELAVGQMLRIGQPVAVLVGPVR